MYIFTIYVYIYIYICIYFIKFLKKYDILERNENHNFVNEWIASWQRNTK